MSYKYVRIEGGQTCSLNMASVAKLKMVVLVSEVNREAMIRN